MKRALFGGSFDPIHYGHIQPVLAAREALALDQVVYLPTARPPHKPGRQFASAHHRLAMAELALLEYEDLLVSPFELTPGRTAYTVETVRHFRAEHPDDELLVLIGSDSLARFETWREWEEILDRARLAVLTRPGWDLAEVRAGLPERLVGLAESGGLDLVANPPVEASSTRLREFLTAGVTPPSQWLPPLVLQYLRKYHLYR